jgi:hypothetical protein
MTDTTMTMAEYARRHRVSKVCVGKWVKRGILAMTPEGLVLVTASDERLAGRPQTYRGGAAKDKSRPAVKGPAPPAPKSAALAVAIARKEAALAGRRELELAILNSRYVEIEEVCRQVENDHALANEVAHNIPGKYCDSLAMQPRQVVFDILQRAIDEMLSMLRAPAEIAQRALDEAEQKPRRRRRP